MTSTGVVTLPNVGPGVVLSRIAVTGWDGADVAGTVISPAGPPRPRATVILGHDLGSDSTTERYLALGADYARTRDFVTVVLDGPFHGGRRPSTLDGLELGPALFDALRVEMARPGHAVRMTADWSALVDLLGSLPGCDAGRIGFEGVSMCSLLGAHFVAAEPRVRCAVFHSTGIRFGADAEGLGDEINGDTLAAQVAAIGDRPVLVMAQAEDELFSRESSLRFFDTLTGPDKELIFLPGGHRGPPATPPAGRRISGGFFHVNLVS